ncbi:hypothetical protein AAF712_003951 [Marasmius tenuissimus]|uniref:Uncharacterized protein n=1 Tax=Marasmius tenuissimus TaxID=585030 RepID=A0ABR3A7H7_9AGAR
MRQIFAQTVHTAFTNTIFRLPTLTPFGGSDHPQATVDNQYPEELRPVIQQAADTLVKSDSVDCAVPACLARVALAGSGPSTKQDQGSVSLTSDDVDIGESISGFLAKRGRPSSQNRRAVPLRRQAILSNRDEGPFARPGQKKVMNKPFFTKWFIHSTHGSIESPPHPDDGIYIEDRHLFVHVNLDALDTTPGVVNLTAVVTVWLWISELERWEPVVPGYSRWVDDQEYVLKVNKNTFEPGWVKRKTVYEDARRRKGKAKDW